MGHSRLAELPETARTGIKDLPWLTAMLRSRITLVAEATPPTRPGAAANVVPSKAFASPATLFAIIVPSSNIAPATFVTAPNKPLATDEMALASPLSFADLRLVRMKENHPFEQRNLLPR
jgi:hypothetical protein